MPKRQEGRGGASITLLLDPPQHSIGANIGAVALKRVLSCCFFRKIFSLQTWARSMIRLSSSTMCISSADEAAATQPQSNRYKLRNDSLNLDRILLPTALTLRDFNVHGADGYDQFGANVVGVANLRIKGDRRMQMSSGRYRKRNISGGPELDTLEDFLSPRQFVGNRLEARCHRKRRRRGEIIIEGR